jgi:hypothetical protein
LSVVALVSAVAFSRSEEVTRGLEFEAFATPPAVVVPATTVAPEVVSSVAPAGSSSLVPKSKAAPASQLAGAGLPTLRQFAIDFPEDPAVFAALLQVHVRSGAPTKQALDDVARLLALKPETAGDRDVLQLVQAAAAQPATSAQAFQLLTGPMGDRGFDTLIALTTGKTSAKVKALQLTKDKTVQAKASPAALIMVKLRDAPGCERRALFEEAEKHADSRSLQYLNPLLKTSGCGIFNMGDCYACLGGRGDLQRAIKAAAGRQPP